MTHEERASAIVDKWLADDPPLAKEALIEAISRGMAEASNEELERRRAVQADLDNLRLLTAAAKHYIDTGWLRRFLAAKAEWSLSTFGAGTRTSGVCAHIRKELDEIEAEPLDLMEWIDIVLLAMDGYWRAYMATSGGKLLEGSPRRLEAAAGSFIENLIKKDNVNRGRKWPEPTGQDEPTEHVREA